MLFRLSFLGLLWAHVCQAAVYNTFDGEGFVACHNVSQVHHPRSLQEIVRIVQDAAKSKTPVRATGKAHMWYDTMCSDDPKTILIQTEDVNQITEFDLKAGTVMIEAGVTFLQFANYLHERKASMGYALVNWNMTIAGSLAMGAHRSSLREASMVAAGALEIHIIDGTGQMRKIVRDESNDDWLAASTSLGLLGIIAKVKFRIYPDFKVYAQQKVLSEKEVLNGDIYAMISPYATANFWWWPGLHKFHYRYYDVVPTEKSNQTGFQNTFSISPLEATIGKSLLNAGKYAATVNHLAEGIFFAAWSIPNFHEKKTDRQILKWPVYGWNYDVLIGGLYPDTKPEWEYGLHGYTFEIAVPVTQANKLLKRVRQLFDASAKAGKPMTSMYRSGINIKFGRPYNDLLGQVVTNTSDGADWSKGAIMFDFPSFWPNVGDHKRYNEPFYGRLATTLLTEFPARPHWTKNTREVMRQAVKNLDPNHLRRFKTVRQKFDPNNIFRSVVGEIIGVM
ncbi:FAD/FMN-containing dehydrogenase [Myriangium duriaei CBS 260.36]|uniref:D-arabinono-1,4-lactone oxidase n=1 Tax=Myriangium duriaei CBS 260.36 TaxID=1168546 RepID=A0A9P4IX83_9PEZI|nr:FAD/FMN-containing dehydrogenase [Myriangium duriaei CBS 260.36]